MMVDDDYAACRSAEGERHVVRDTTNDVLHYGINKLRLKKVQSSKFLSLQHKIVKRQDSARVLLISANVMSMSVMASQLGMHRWKVSQSQTVAQATSIIQEEVAEAHRRGYRVVRPHAKPMGASKYAGHGGLQKLYEEKKAKLERWKRRRADAVAAAGTSLEDDADFYLAQDSSSSSSSTSRRGSGSSASSTAAALPEWGRNVNSTPADAVTRLVIVDCFTHEPFQDIIQHLRFLDRENGLELVVMLLLPQSMFSVSTASEMQGAGVVITPQYDTSMGAAYACGYDLVLTRYVDHVVVEFLTNTFVSSAGRWRNDIRRKAAVGNYISLKNVLMGRIDADALRRLVWNETVDDAEILDLIGNNSLGQKGETRSYSHAAQQLSRQQTNVPGSPLQPADVLVVDDDLQAPPSGSGILPMGIHRLRGKEANRMGVRSTSANVSQMRTFSSRGDVLNATISTRPPTGRRLDCLGVEDDEAQVAFAQAVEKELARLATENDNQQGTIGLLQEELERQHRTIVVLKKSLSGYEGVQKLKVGESERPDSAALVNLSKEQQIYILKERLEAVNAKLFSSKEDGRRPRSGVNIGVRRWGAGIGENAPKTGESQVTPAERTWRAAYSAYMEGREHDLMSLHDIDASFMEALTQDEQLTQSLNATLLRKQMATGKAKERGKNRQERQRTDDVINELERELLEAMHGNVDNIRLTRHLEDAVERLNAQKERIGQLEEMRMMDAAMHARQLATARDAAAHVDTGGRSKRGASHASSAVRTRTRATPQKVSITTPSSVPIAVQTAADPVAPDSVRSGEVEQLKRLHRAEMESLARSLELKGKEACQKAVENLERQMHRDMAKREQLLKERLEELTIKVRKPYTSRHRAILKRERNAAKDEARSVLQRLQFALSNLSPTEKREEDGEGGRVAGPIAQVADPVVRRRLMDYAKEYALHTLHAAQADEGIRKVDAAVQSSAGKEERRGLLASYEEVVAHAETVYAQDKDLSNYFTALRDVVAVEDQLSRWENPDLQEALSLPPLTTISAPLDVVEPDALPRTLADSSLVALATPDALPVPERDEVSQVIQDAKVSETQRELYRTIQHDNEHGYIHPDRMVDVDNTACLGPALVGDSQRWAPLYDTHHGELIRLIRLLSIRDPFLAPLLLSHTRSLEARISRELMIAGAQTPEQAAASPSITLPFLLSMDTALTTSVIDLLSSVVTERSLLRHLQLADVKADGHAYHPTLDDESATLEELIGNVPLRHLAKSDERLAAYKATRSSAVTMLRRVVQDNAAASGVISSLRAAPDSGDVPNQFFIPDEDSQTLSHPPTDTPGRGVAVGATASGDDDFFMTATNEAGYAAEDLAALFTVRKPQGDVPNLEEIYLELDGNLDPTDDNGVAMRNIREELDYLAQVRRQRMDELVLRYRMRQRQKEARRPTPPVLPDPASMSLDVPDFEVRQGSPAWYGMEAAKRVKDILRRHAQPDHVTVGGGPNGGDVGIELSRRTLFPRAPPRDVPVMQTSEERLRAAHTALPPIKQRGLSRWQQRRTAAGGGTDEDVYYHPRDVTSIDAFNYVVSQFTFDGMDRFLYTPQEMTERMLEYRAAMCRASSRLGVGSPTVASSLGPGYYLPVITGPVTPHTRSPVTSRTGPQPLPISRWTYGVPSEELGHMMMTPAEKSDTVVFLPHRNTSAEGDETAAAQRTRHLHRQHYLRGAGPHVFVSPAALAAQRLTALLHLSVNRSSPNQDASPSSLRRATTTGGPRSPPTGRRHTTATHVCPSASPPSASPAINSPRRGLLSPPQPLSSGNLGGASPEHLTQGSSSQQQQQPPAESSSPARATDEP